MMDPPGYSAVAPPVAVGRQRERGGTPRCTRVERILIFTICFTILSLLKLEPIARNSVQDHHNRIIDLPHEEKNLSKSTTSFTVDILSVGSINQLNLLHAQLNTIATHTSVRNFFNVTELDDADPNCHTDITGEHVKKVSVYCRSRRAMWIGPIFQTLSKQYGRWEWLQKKKNPTGWLCAQVRPYSGLLKAQSHYKRTGQELPDYFLIFDDDTYYNMELFQKNFATVDSSAERVYSGCLVRLPIHMINFTFPFGGFGSILSKGALKKLFGRNQCPGLDNTANDDSNNRSSNYNNNTEELLTKDSSSAYCSRLKENNAGELKYFTDGMSLVDLMYNYTSTDKYRDVDKWGFGSGFCMHSVRIIYFIYNIMPCCCCIKGYVVLKRLNHRFS
jgi:hypothetical protein